MEATHIVFDREYKVDLPDDLNIDKYRKLVPELPDVDADKISLQIKDAYLEFYCKCGCHSFCFARVGVAAWPLHGVITCN